MTIAISRFNRLQLCKECIVLSADPAYSWIFELIEAKQKLRHIAGSAQYWLIHPDHDGKQIFFDCYQQPSGVKILKTSVEMFAEMDEIKPFSVIVSNSTCVMCTNDLIETNLASESQSAN